MANLKWLLLICASEALFSIYAEYQWCPIKWAASTKCCVRIGWLILSETERLFYTQQEGHLLTLKSAKVLLFLRKSNCIFVDTSLLQMKTDSWKFSTKRKYTVFNKYIYKAYIYFLFFSSGLLQYFDIVPIRHYSHGQKCTHIMVYGSALIKESQVTHSRTGFCDSYVDPPTVRKSILLLFQ